MLTVWPSKGYPAPLCNRQTPDRPRTDMHGRLTQPLDRVHKLVKEREYTVDTLLVTVGLGRGVKLAEKVHDVVKVGQRLLGNLGVRGLYVHDMDAHRIQHGILACTREGVDLVVRLREHFSNVGDLGRCLDANILRPVRRALEVF